MKTRYGLVFIALSFIFCIELFLLSKTDIAVIVVKPWLSLAQLSGLLGVIAYSITFFLSSRLGVLENMFGGLDTVYRIHQRMGRVSFILLSSHFIGLLLHYNALPAMVNKLLIPSTNIAYTAGILSFWVLAFILALVIFAKLEYQLFVRVQTFFILSFVLGFIHSLYIESDISGYLFLRVYILTFFGLGLFSFIYRQILYYWVGPKHEYVVSSSKRAQNGWIQLKMLAQEHEMRYVPGQFVYIGFLKQGIKTETHPFSIVSVPEDGHMEVWIKPVGEYTNELTLIAPGDKAVIYGPYGTLYEKIFGKDNIICIAGGIGITPFLGMVRYFARQIPKTTFHVYYSIRSKKEAADLELERYFPSELSNVMYHVRATETDQRLTGEYIMNETGKSNRTMYLLCGPHAMMLSMKQQLYAAGVNPRMVCYEEFSY
jgi:predicted ferric reductase